MLIILEGPKGSGKSTLADRLVAHISLHSTSPVKVLHKGVPTAHPVDEYEVPLLDYRPTGEYHVICDRWHLGELVYPYIYGRETQLTQGIFAHIEAFLRSRGALLVYVSGDPDVLVERVERRDGHDAKNALIPVSIRRFGEMLSKTQLWRYGWGIVADATRGIAAAARRAESDASSIPARTYVGPPRPQILVLGDRRKNPTGLNGRGVAFMPYPATSGAYLFEQLGNAGGIGFANACDVDDPEELWLQLRQPPTVALGVNAERALTFPHGAVPHPQFVRRFHHRAGSEYASVLLHAAESGEDMLSWRPRS